MARARSTGAAGRNALTVTIDTPGLAEKIAELQKFAKIGDTDARRVRWGMNRTVKVVLGQAQETTPVRSGTMKGTLFGKTKTWSEGNITGNVGIGERGPKPFALEGGRSPMAKRGALKAIRFLWRAYIQVKDQVDETWVKVLRLITEDLAKKK